LWTLRGSDPTALPVLPTRHPHLPPPVGVDLILDLIVSGRVERPVTSGRLRQDWALAGAGIADFLAPLQAAGRGGTRMPDRADQ